MAYFCFPRSTTALAFFCVISCLQPFAAALLLLDHSQDIVQEDPVIQRRQSGNPSSANFLRRGNHGTAIVGDYIYIDGGEISQSITGSNPKLQTSNLTLSIDLSSSWTNSSVQIQSIEKGDAPILNNQGLWPDGNGSFYLFAGELSPLLHGLAPDVALWKFTTTSSGGGTWEEQVPSEPGTFNQLTRPGQAFIASSTHAGYALDGFSYNTTDPKMGAYRRVSGMLSYDWDSGKWSNRSAPADGDDATISGQMHYVPSFGKDGLLFMFGGETGDYLAYDIAASNENRKLPFYNLTIYDPETDAWYWQTTTGDPPSERKFFCVAGAAGNNTYEIFVMGGYAYGETSDDIYVLSLPGFHWFKVPVTLGSPRASQSCNNVGNRQMLVIGGLNHDEKVYGWYERDPWTQGLGIFDMTELRWASGYDAGAAAYESPQMVQEWYAQGNTKDVTWRNNQVQALFASAANESANSTSTSSANSSAKSSNKNTGAIVGGAVGGSAGMLLVGGLAWLLFRRWRKAGVAERMVQHEQQEPRFVEVDGAYQTISELPSSLPEMATKDATPELPLNEVPRPPAARR